MSGKLARLSMPVGHILVALLLMGACGAAIAVKSVADRAARNDASVLRALAEVRMQDALEWRAISGAGSADAAALHDASVAESVGLLVDTTLDEATVTRLVTEQRAYAAVVRREFELLAAGREQQAEEWDENRVDPAAETLLEDLEAVAVRMDAASQTASWWTGVGLVATLLLSLGLMALVQRRLQTDRARQQQYQLSEARYRAIIDRSSDLVLVCDRDGEIGYLSPAGRRVLGDTVPGRSPSLVAALAPDDRARLRELLQEATRSGEAGPVDLRLTAAASGDAAIHRFTARDLHSHPSVRGIVLTGQDVTAARQLDQARTDFVGTVSHELRTPLTSICGYTELVQDGGFGPVPDELRPAIATVDRNARLLLGLVNELLFLSELDAGVTTAGPHRLDLIQLVELVVADARVAHRGRRVDLNLSHAPQGALVLGVRDDLERVVGNLIANAVKFSPHGDPVTVAVIVRPDDAEITVTDHGIGIPIEEQDRLFSRFFRSSLSQHHAIPGTGLGLAVCNAVVDAHAGSISIESRSGEGATVLVRLPLAASDVHPSSSVPVDAVLAVPGSRRT